MTSHFLKIYPSEIRKTFVKPNVYILPSELLIKTGPHPDLFGTSYLVQDNSGGLRCWSSSNPVYLGFDLTSLLFDGFLHFLFVNLINRPNPILQFNTIFKSQCFKLGNIHQLSWCSIRLGGIKPQFSLKANYILDQQCKLFD